MHGLVFIVPPQFHTYISVLQWSTCSQVLYENHIRFCHLGDYRRPGCMPQVKIPKCFKTFTKLLSELCYILKGCFGFDCLKMSTLNLGMDVWSTNLSIQSVSVDLITWWLNAASILACPLVLGGWLHGASALYWAGYIDFLFLALFPRIYYKELMVELFGMWYVVVIWGIHMLGSGVN